ncbi:ABC transporter permease [Serinibacter salmoneus]|uniref:Putative ABC transport system permease protein n=1 Tax=Serinibacter salmoneus TaxID=556530 RepID=A0A2A9D3E8_9MICO|nr:FtsX-like permease family protein [Serinibacter salmoneus]PFG21184.1 putative ABC transport system permease protein [Serinibacter salmoneus]
MWRLTRAQMRRNLGRLVAVGIAIALGTGFVTATYVATNAIEDTALAAAGASLGDPDVVITDPSYDLTGEDIAALADTPGVAETYAWQNVVREVAAGGGREVVLLNAPAANPRLSPATLAEGKLPTASGEIALPRGTAERLGVALGDEVASRSAAEGARPGEIVRLVGLLEDTTGLGASLGASLATPQDLNAWASEGFADETLPVGTVTLVTDGTDPAQVASAVQEASLDDGGEGLIVQTASERAAERAAQLTGGINVFRGLILGFAAVAMAVAGIVIANTFTVLIAQRTQSLALLRCVGATRSQVKRSVRQEALVLGAVASLAGIALGLALGQAALLAIRRYGAGVPAPAVVPVDAATFLVPLAAGILVTVVAADGAARLATSVSPLAAMRPVDTLISARSRRARPIAGWVLVAIGFAVMAGALALAQSGDAAASFGPALALGVLGGVITVVGVVMAAIQIVPAIGRLLARGVTRLGGVPARLAATNAVRNPRRITSTATALLVGVTLVTMMATGAGMARDQLDAELAEQYAIDLMVSGTEVSPATREAVEALDGVTASALLAGHQVTLETGDGETQVTALAVDPDALAPVLATAPQNWGPGIALVSPADADESATVTVDGIEFAALPTPGLPAYSIILAAEDAARLDVQPIEETLWLAVASDADAVGLANAVRDAVSDTTVSDTTAGGAALSVGGGAVDRAAVAQVIDTMLAVVLGLLAVAVVIALIGVANTLSLSVLERRRENALLRALGLTRAQLRATLAVEGVLLAVVGALVGLVLGLVYGWIGGLLLLGPTTGLTLGALSVPWGAVAAVLGVALAAGVAASVLPARGAVRVPPVAALAAD